MMKDGMHGSRSAVHAGTHRSKREMQSLAAHGTSVMINVMKSSSRRVQDKNRVQEGIEFKI
jgi:hypothetical protein